MGEEPEEIRREIEETRARMTDTVEAIGYKADVPARVKETISDTKDRIMGRASEFGSQISDRAGELRSQIMGRSSDVMDRTGDVAGDIGTQASQQAGRLRRLVEDNPLGLAIGSLAVGFLAGIFIPSSRVEDRAMGQVADEVKGRAKEMGQSAIEHGKDVATDTFQAAKDTATQRTKEETQEMREEVTTR